MSAAANIGRMAIGASFSHRREMARRFGYVEPYNDRWCVRFQIEGHVHRIASLETPTGRRIAIRDQATAEEILDEIRVWRAMEKRLGLPHVKPNEALRHCFGTRTAERLIRDGMSRDSAQEAVMRVMGHTSRVTSDRYVKLASETLRGVIE